MKNVKIQESEKVWHKKNIKKEVDLDFEGTEKECEEAIEIYKSKINEFLNDGWEFCGGDKETHARVCKPMSESYPDSEYWSSKTNHYVVAYNQLKKQFSPKKIARRLKLTEDLVLNKILTARRDRCKRNGYRKRISERLELIDAYENTDCKFEVFNRSTKEWNRADSPSFDDLKKWYRIAKN